MTRTYVPSTHSSGTDHNTLENLVTADTNVTTQPVTDTQPVADAQPVAEPTPEPVRAPDAIDKAIEKLFALMMAESKKNETPAIIGQRAMLANMKSNEYAEHMTAAISQLQHDIDTATETASLAIRAEMFRNYAPALASMSRWLNPVPTAATTLKPASKRSATSERTVARTAADIDADPSIEYIGGPVADVDAVGHECGLTSILRNGTKKIGNLTQQMTECVTGGDPAMHAACLAIGKSVQPLFGRRAQLRNAAA